MSCGSGKAMKATFKTAAASIAAPLPTGSPPTSSPPPRPCHDPHHRLAARRPDFLPDRCVRPPPPAGKPGVRHRPVRTDPVCYRGANPRAAICLRPYWASPDSHFAPNHSHPMSNSYRAEPWQWHKEETLSKADNHYISDTHCCILELRARVEALEQGDPAHQHVRRHLIEVSRIIAEQTGADAGIYLLTLNINALTYARAVWDHARQRCTDA